MSGHWVKTAAVLAIIQAVSGSLFVASATEQNAPEASVSEANDSAFKSTPVGEESAPPSSAPATTEAKPAPASAAPGQLADPSTIVIPTSEPIIPPGRPDWIAQYGVRGPAERKQVAVCSGPFVTEQEARAELHQQIKKAADRYLEATLGSAQAPLLLGYSPEVLASRLVNGNHVYPETIQVSVGPMKQVHALVEFSPDFDREVQHRWRQIRSASRVGGVALVGAIALGMLLTFFGYLRADTSTRGYYTTRLKFAAGGAILALVVAGWMASHWVSWL